MAATQTNEENYVLGHSSHELDRLIVQGQFLGGLTSQLFNFAGMKPGMRVLDIGCGTGDVAFLARRLVGADGEVICVDKSPDAIAIARQRAEQAQLLNMRFIVSDLNDLVLDEPVDVLVGRFILVHLSQPADAIRQLLSFVKPGGIIAFQEPDGVSVITDPPCSEFETIVEWICETFTRVGVDPRLGLKLPSIFREAGLTSAETFQMARVEHGEDSPLYEYMAHSIKSLLVPMQKTGVATLEQIQPDTLAERLRAEALEKNAVVVYPQMIGALARKPL